MAMVMATALLGVGPPPSTTAGDPVVLWLGPFASGALDDAALLEAVSVYTRDLSLETRTATDVSPPTPAARAAGVDAAAGASIRAHGARLGFWCEPAPDARTTALIIVDGEGRLEVRVVDSAGLDGPELYRAIALKLRAVLAATIGPEVAAIPGAAPRASSSSSSSSPAPAAAVAPPAGAAGPGDAAARGGAGAVVVTAAPPVPSRPARFFAALGYRVSTPLGAGSIQQGAAAEGGAHLGRAVELALGAALETRATASSGAGTVSLFDLPIEVEARWIRPRAGPSASFLGGRRLCGGPSVVGHGHRCDGRATDLLRSRGRTRRRGARARRARRRHLRRSAPLHRASPPEHDLLGAGGPGPRPRRARRSRAGAGLSSALRPPP